MSKVFPLLCGLLLALAVPAHAASKYVGTWYAGDNVHLLRLEVRDDSRVAWGTAVGLGYVPTLEVRKAGSTTLFTTLTGAWQDATNAAVLVAPGSVTILAPTSGYSDYDFILVLTKGSSVARLAADGASQPFTFRVQVYP